MILEEFKLDGNVAILTGCGQSWLKGLGLALAEAGATVVIAGPEKKQIESGIEEIRKLGRSTMAVLTDLTSAAEIQNLIDQTMSKFGRIDILVNNLNLEFGKPFLEVTEEEWRRVIRCQSHRSLPLFEGSRQAHGRSKSGQNRQHCYGSSGKGVVQRHGLLRQYGWCGPVHSCSGPGVGKEKRTD